MLTTAVSETYCTSDDKVPKHCKTAAKHKFKLNKDIYDLEQMTSILETVSAS